jgi:hypothetical protein
MNENNTSMEQLEQKIPKESAAARWRKRIEQQRESGLAVSAYCREQGLSAASMFAWKRRLRPTGSVPLRQTFKPVKVVSETLKQSTDRLDGVIELSAASFVELCLRGERHVIVRRGFDRQLLIDLVQALESLA